MTTDALTSTDLRSAIQTALDTFFDGHSEILEQASPDAGVLTDSLRTLVHGGKRLRPTFAYWGYRSTGNGHSDEIVRVATSLEFLQACALIHDDVMDGSDTRRGNPSVHRQFEALHTSSGWNGDGANFGLGAAILVGDLALSWADTMLCTSGLTDAQLQRAKSVYDTMRAELMAGQYLDLLEQSRGGTTIDQARNVIKYKSAKYTIERPLEMGAAIADAPTTVRTLLSTYGLAIGEAFQLRDDLLGVFGETHVTGKPAGDDLREGKQTILVALTQNLGTESTNELLKKHLGNPALDSATIAVLQDAIQETGAVDAIEQDIARLTETAINAISNENIDPIAGQALTELAISATQRSA